MKDILKAYNYNFSCYKMKDQNKNKYIGIRQHFGTDVFCQLMHYNIYEEYWLL